MTRIVIIIIGILYLASCQDKAKVIAPSSTQNESQSSTGIFNDSKGGNQQGNSNTNNTANDIHHIQVNEVLPTEKYIYLNVSEGDENYWVAVQKQDVKVGDKYFFRNGLLKTNFESKEYNRVFDKVYLVSQLIAENDSQTGSNKAPISESQKSSASKTKIKTSPHSENSISIASIVDNPKDYEGKEVQISGTCTKLNPNIMGRNWIHIKDGSKDDYDFVLTSSQPIPEGHVVTMKGILVLDKDFGSGYRYDLLVENASIVQ